MSLRSPLGHAKGLGSAKEGLSHWWVQRITAVALVPMILWMTISMIGLVGAEHADVVSWMSSPLNTTLLVLLVIALFYHSDLGLQVIIEDYVHEEAAKIACLIITKFAMIFLGGLCVISVLQVAFGG
jgi:succinate dehydrogenase / fumarate reductase membrane anchor subunit